MQAARVSITGATPPGPQFVSAARAAVLVTCDIAAPDFGAATVAIPNEALALEWNGFHSNGNACRLRSRERVVEIFASKGSHQPLDERMRARHKGDGLEFLDVENSQIRPQAMRPEQWVMILSANEGSVKSQQMSPA